MYIGVRCLNHRYAISIKGWTRWSGCSACLSLCVLCYLSVLSSRFTAFFVSLWFENEIYVPVLLLWTREWTMLVSTRCSFIHSFSSYECFHCTQKIRKFACTSLLALLCFALFLMSSLSAPQNVHRTHSSPSLSSLVFVYFKRRNLLEHKQTLNI